MLPPLQLNGLRPNPLATMPRRYTYRLLWSPGTIGPLTWLWRNENGLHRVRHANN